MRLISFLMVFRIEDVELNRTLIKIDIPGIESKKVGRQICSPAVHETLVIKAIPISDVNRSENI